MQEAGEGVTCFLSWQKEPVLGGTGTRLRPLNSAFMRHSKYSPVKNTPS